MSTEHSTRAPLYLANISRRKMLQGAGVSGAFVLAARWNPGLAADSEETEYGADAMPHAWVDDPDVFISFAEDGTVTIVNHRAEMGQGIRTSLLMVMADELGADWDQVVVEQAIGNEEKYGNQNTDGSRSMRHFFAPLRRAGAAARTMLEEAASLQWDVPLSECQAAVHEVIHVPSQRRLTFGELSKTAASLPVPDMQSLVMKTPEQWRYIMRDPAEYARGEGNPPLNIDGRDIATGQALYAADVAYENMLYAVIARPPSYGTAVRSFDASQTLKVKGVVDVIELPTASQPSAFEPLGGIAVLAESTWAAIKGRMALVIDWDDGPAGDNATYDTARYRKKLEETASRSGEVIREEGNFKEAVQQADNHLSVNYYLPHLAQSPMEPMAAVVRIDGDSAEVWTSNQNPQATRDGVAMRLGLEPTNVTVKCALMGGAFGRKAKPDFVFEAADLSRAMGGRPVRVQWTREDDLQHSYYHAAGLEHMEGCLDEQGKVSGWLHRTLAPSISSQFAPGVTHLSASELGMGFTSMPFDIPAILLENGEATGHVRIGWFRSVYNLPHAFAIQSFVAELAHAANRDHKELLLELLGPDRQIDTRDLGDTWNYGEDPEIYLADIGRYRGVIERATTEAGWGKEMPENRGLGLAVHYSFVSYCAVVLDVEVSAEGEVIVHSADIAFDCGPQVNPDRVSSQLEGACIMGIGIALMSEISAKDGKIEQDNFHQYLVPRMEHAPRIIRTHVVNNDIDVPMGGAGEPGLPPIAPAVCNAIFAATGKRIRTLPVGRQLST